MQTTTLTFRISIRAGQQTVFNYISDWEKQSDWILFTTVKRLTKPATEQDAQLLAITKFGPIHFSDTMVMTSWQPPEKIVVEHTGRIILGKGVFTVHRISDNSCEFIWQEITPVPFGFIGHVGLFFIKPLLRIMFTMSLRKLKATIESIA